MVLWSGIQRTGEQKQAKGKRDSSHSSCTLWDWRGSQQGLCIPREWDTEAAEQKQRRERWAPTEMWERAQIAAPRSEVVTVFCCAGADQD